MENMEIFIRTDASIQIGSGHVMRCLTLAKQLQKINVVVKFICRRLDGNMINYIVGQGFEVFTLHEIDTISHWDWTKKNWLEDARETIFAIQLEQRDIDMLIVDHYSIDIQWEQQLRPFVKKIMVIDDIADRKHDCDLLLDQNYYLNMEQRYENLIPKNCIQLLGPNNALLREEFLDINPVKFDRDGSIKNILIFFGGSDSTGATLIAIQAVKELEHHVVEVHVVVGAANPHKKKIKLACEGIPNIKYHCQIDNISELMVKADLAIGAGGATTWERCYLKLPSLTTIIAENQFEVTNAVSVQGSTISLGKICELSKELIKRELKSLFEETVKLKRMSVQCGELVNREKLREYSLISKIMEMIS